MFPRRVQIFSSVLIFILMITAGLALSVLRDDSIHQGVDIAGVDVSGLSMEQAEDRLNPLSEGFIHEQVTLRHDDEAFTLTIAELGGEADIRACILAAHRVGREGNPVRKIMDIISARRHGVSLPVQYIFENEIAEDRLRVIAEQIDQDPIDARLVIEENGIGTIPEKRGVKLETDETLSRIVQAINSGNTEAALITSSVEPKIFATDFEGIDAVVGTYSTSFNPGERDRSHNLRVAAQSVDGTLMKPGDTFSYNDIVGPRTKERGFRDAPMFVRGEIEHGVGGGICQISSTVYNAALLANMKIVSRVPHSRPVTYAPVGLDATVAYSLLDLKFQNTGDVPVYILATVEDRTVEVSVLGKSVPNREIKIVRSGHQVIAAPVVEEVDDSLEPGEKKVINSGRSGHRISVHRIIEIDGDVATRELISNDYYRPEEKVVAVAPEST